MLLNKSFYNLVAYLIALYNIEIMKSFIITMVLFILSIITMGIPHSDATLIMFAITMLLIVGVLSSLLSTVWFTGDFDIRFIKAIKISFPLTFIVYLIGFSITLIETLIKQ